VIGHPDLRRYCAFMKAYKFRPNWHDKKYSSLLTDDLVYFASPETFNDPFDCKIHLRYDLEKPDDLRKVITKLFVDHEPNSTKEQIDASVEEAFVRVVNPDNQDEIYQTKEEIMDRSLGIFSLAGIHDNILLWSHYGDSHRGFCIEYDIDILKNYFDELLESDNIFVVDTAIKYVSEYPTLIPSKLADDEWLVSQVSYKFQDWSYEKEYRFVLMDRTNLPLHIPCEAITGVILGYKMSAEAEKSIKNALLRMEHRPRLMRAKRNRDTFDLQFVPVDY